MWRARELRGAPGSASAEWTPSPGAPRIRQPLRKACCRHSQRTNSFAGDDVPVPAAMSVVHDRCVFEALLLAICRAPDQVPGSPPASRQQTELQQPEQPGRPSEQAAHQAARYQHVQHRRRLAPEFDRQVDAYHELFDLYDVNQVYEAGQADQSSSRCASSDLKAHVMILVKRQAAC